MKDKIKIILADDHRVLLDGLKSFVADTDDIEVAGVANNGHYAFQLIEEHPDTDIAVLDLRMPVMDGLETTLKIKEAYPKIKVLILTMHKEVNQVNKIIEAGASGYILKSKGGNELVGAIRAIHQGEEYFGKVVTDALIENARNSKGASRQKTEFTPREVDVLKLIGEGLTSKKISEKLHIAVSTVETHRRNLIDKTGSPNSKELMRYAIRKGFAQA